MEELIFRFIGAIGLILISVGILYQTAKGRNILFAIGGSLILIYGIYQKDPIFIPLEIIFVLASLYELRKLKTKNK